MMVRLYHRKRLFVLVLFILLICVGIFVRSRRSVHLCINLFIHKQQLSQENSNLIELHRKHMTLKRAFKRTRNNVNFIKFLDKPSVEYESLRRRIKENVQDMWRYVKHEIVMLLTENKGHAVEKFSSILNKITERKSSLMADLKKIHTVDGYNKWRHQEAAEVSDLIQRRIRYLQNPLDCKNARKLVCDLPNECGFGCQLHHIVYCIIHAYATKRTFILNSTKWNYNKKGWENMFQPLSDTCTSVYGVSPVVWPSNNAQVVFVETHYKYYEHKPAFLPFALPADLAHRITLFNGDPVSWWISQLLKYVLRPNADTQKAVDDIIEKINFKSPVVGLQVRRTDKLRFQEAGYHDLQEYMVHVTDYYDTLELTQPVHMRLVYIASDSVLAFKEAQEKYPSYQFLGEASRAPVYSRYTPQSLIGVLVDLQLLARSSHLVCTFTSNMCRVAYELMQASGVDASEDVTSLDVMYYFRIGPMMNPPLRVAVTEHFPLASRIKGDISFKKGDLIELHSPGNYFNGYGRGINMRTKESGRFPWYKTADQEQLYQFPEYKSLSEECDIQNN